jgi:hypothetical protein
MTCRGTYTTDQALAMVGGAGEERVAYRDTHALQSGVIAKLTKVGAIGRARPRQGIAWIGLG